MLSAGITNSVDGIIELFCCVKCALLQQPVRQVMGQKLCVVHAVLMQP